MKRFAFPAMNEYTLTNGLKIILIPDGEQAAFVMALQLPFGHFADPPKYEGCSEVCVGLLQRGTASYGAENFTDELEHRGASLFADVGEEHATIGIKMMSHFKDELFPVYWEMITAPRFDKKEFLRLQQEMITGMKADRIDPGTIAIRHFYDELAGATSHPAGRHSTLSTVQRLNRTMVMDFYDDHFMPDGCTLVVAGDFTSEWFASKCLPLVTSWKSVHQRQRCEAPPLLNEQSAVRFVERNDLTQASIVIGQSAPGELDRDRIATALANYALGAGNFTSRLMTRIRSSAGKTYSINSHITAERRFGIVTISTSTQNRQLGEVISAIRQEYDLFCKKGITADELDNVKKFVTGNMAFQMEGLSNLVDKVLWLNFYNRSIDYLESFNTMINDVTLESVNEAVARWFNSEKIIIIGVGKKAEVLSQLTELGRVKRFHYRAAI